MLCVFLKKVVLETTRTGQNDSLKLNIVNYAFHEEISSPQKKLARNHCSLITFTLNGKVKFVCQPCENVIGYLSFIRLKVRGLNLQINHYIKSKGVLSVNLSRNSSQ